MNKEVWKSCLGSLRLSREDIEQIIAEHMAARFGVSTVKVELWPQQGNYGTDSFANVDMPEFMDAFRIEA